MSKSLYAAIADSCSARDMTWLEIKISILDEIHPHILDEPAEIKINLVHEFEASLQSCPEGCQCWLTAIMACERKLETSYSPCAEKQLRAICQDYSDWMTPLREYYWPRYLSLEAVSPEHTFVPYGAHLEADEARHRNLLPLPPPSSRLLEGSGSVLPHGQQTCDAPGMDHISAPARLYVLSCLQMARLDREAGAILMNVKGASDDLKTNLIALHTSPRLLSECNLLETIFASHVTRLDNATIDVAFWLSLLRAITQALAPITCITPRPLARFQLEAERLFTQLPSDLQGSIRAEAAQPDLATFIQPSSSLRFLRIAKQTRGMNGKRQDRNTIALRMQLGEVSIGPRGQAAEVEQYHEDLRKAQRKRQRYHDRLLQEEKRLKSRLAARLARYRQQREQQERADSLRLKRLLRNPEETERFRKYLFKQGGGMESFLLFHLKVGPSLCSS
eukprot:TRINITY_DN10903_c1_g3_i1.p1 TRINITY_DN10903_c1_g3~~TRINITY_DN10903_c1_g3_i1.p1  ORF type:complete len:474 (+),score=61.45 TRINITY_DN10903_c1_g3_i1:79-1422(+)